MRIDEDNLSPDCPMDLVFQAMARLAGTLEANRALRRSAAAAKVADDGSPKKKRGSHLVVRNDNTTYPVVPNETEGDGW